MIELIYKKCATCGQFYPGLIGDIHNRCPRHADSFKYTIQSIKKTRSISPGVYDLYWMDDQGDYHRACRGCGKHLLKKNGQPISNECNRRWCSEACYKSLPSPNWGQTVLQFLHTVPHQEIRGEYYNYYTKIQCGKCGEWTDVKDIDIHHIRPVSTLVESELNLIWDFKNLMPLCKKCHNGDVHQDIYRKRRDDRKAEFKRLWKVLIP